MKRKKIRFFLMVVLLASSMVTGVADHSAAENPASISGSISDRETGEPLPGVSVMVQGAKLGTYSDLDGYFKLKNLEPGTYALIFSLIGYQGSKVDSIMVEAGQTRSLEDVFLRPEAVEVRGVEVTAKRVTNTEAALLRIQMKAPSISDGISAEQISKSPDSDAASALKRISGVTVVGGKYVYVRGMGERYSNTLLNGATLPSPEPKKRVVPMDIIPANLLDNVVTTKTFTPDQWGSFSGGSVRLKTKEFPEKFTLKFSASSGGNTETTGRTVHQDGGGATDWLGVDDGTREIPKLVYEAVKEGWSGVGDWNGHINAELAQSFRHVWDGSPRRAPLNQNYSLSLGSQTEISGRPLGYVFSLTYGSKYKYRQEKQRVFNAGMNLRSDWNIEETIYAISWGGILNLNFKPHPYHKLLLNTTYTRDAEDQVRWMDGYYEQRMWLENRLKWAEQSLAHFRLSGEHELPSIWSSHIDWSASYGEAQREEPDESTLLWCKDDPGDSDDMYYINSQKSGGNRFWEDSQDENYGFSLDWTKDFTQWNGLPAKFKTGWAIEKMDRKDHMWFFDLSASPPPGEWYQNKDSLKEHRPTQIALIPSKGLRWAGAQSYNADKRIDGAYFSFDMPVFKRLRMIAGLRVEDTKVNITYNPVGNFELKDNVEKNQTDWLPSVNLTYGLSENMNLRAGATKTITRPEYYELIQREDREIFESLKSYGNPDLEHTRIYNYDLRWEDYPRPGEMFAVSVFYKRFKKPIESIFTIMGTLTVIPVNMEAAENYGIEFEVRKNLDFVWGRLSGFSVNANYAIIQSRVEIDETGMSTFKPTNLDRALMGQSPYVVNATLGYENQHGASLRVLYNRFGERIAYIGALGNPDIIEKPFDQLDLAIEQKLWGRLGLKLNAANLLDSESEFMQGDKDVWLPHKAEYVSPVWREYKEGVSFSVGLSYSI